MNILILNGSPRVNGNTSAHVAAFKEGAERVVSYFGAELVAIKAVYGSNNKSKWTLHEMRKLGASL